MDATDATEAVASTPAALGPWLTLFLTLLLGTFNLATGVWTMTKLFETSIKVKFALASLLITLLAQIVVSSLVCRQSILNGSDSVSSGAWTSVLILDFVIAMVATGVIGLAYHGGLIQAAGWKRGPQHTFTAALVIFKAAQIASLVNVPLEAQRSNADGTDNTSPPFAPILCCIFLLLELMALSVVMVFERDRLYPESHLWLTWTRKARKSSQIIFASPLVPVGLLVASIATFSLKARSGGVAVLITLYAQLQLTASIASASLMSKSSVTSQDPFFRFHQRPTSTHSRYNGSVQGAETRLQMSSSHHPMPSIFVSFDNGNNAESKKHDGTVNEDMDGSREKFELRVVNTSDSALLHRRSSSRSGSMIRLPSAPAPLITNPGTTIGTSTSRLSPQALLSCSVGSQSTQLCMDGHDSPADYSASSGFLSPNPSIGDEGMATICEEPGSSDTPLRREPSSGRMTPNKGRGRAWSRSNAFVFPRSRMQPHAEMAVGNSANETTGSIIGAYMDMTRDTLRRALSAASNLTRSRDALGSKVLKAGQRHCPPDALCNRCLSYQTIDDVLNNYEFAIGMDTGVTVNRPTSSKYELPQTADYGGAGLDRVRAGAETPDTIGSVVPTVPGLTFGRGFVVDAASLLNMNVSDPQLDQLKLGHDAASTRDKAEVEQLAETMESAGIAEDDVDASEDVTSTSNTLASGAASNGDRIRKAGKAPESRMGSAASWSRRTSTATTLTPDRFSSFPRRPSVFSSRRPSAAASNQERPKSRLHGSMSVASRPSTALLVRFGGAGAGGSGSYSGGRFPASVNSAFSRLSHVYQSQSQSRRRSSTMMAMPTTPTPQASRPGSPVAESVVLDAHSPAESVVSSVDSEPTVRVCNTVRISEIRPVTSTGDLSQTAAEVSVKSTPTTSVLSKPAPAHSSMTLASATFDVAVPLASPALSSSEDVEAAPTILYVQSSTHAPTPTSPLSPIQDTTLLLSPVEAKDDRSKVALIPGRNRSVNFALPKVVEATMAELAASESASVRGSLLVSAASNDTDTETNTSTEPRSALGTESSDVSDSESGAKAPCSRVPVLDQPSSEGSYTSDDGGDTSTLTGIQTHDEDGGRRGRRSGVSGGASSAGSEDWLQSIG